MVLGIAAQRMQVGLDNLLPALLTLAVLVLVAAYASNYTY